MLKNIMSFHKHIHRCHTVVFYESEMNADKSGTVEVYGEYFLLIGLFSLLHLHVSIIFLNLQPTNVITKIQGVGSLAM